MAPPGSLLLRPSVHALAVASREVYSAAVTTRAAGTGEEGVRGHRLPITREAENGVFVYRLEGRRIGKRSEIGRIETLAIPPAWNDVEIARSPSAKVLARDVDAAGRTQSIYHPRFRRRDVHEYVKRHIRSGSATLRQ